MNSKYPPIASSSSPPFTPPATLAQPRLQATSIARPIHMILDFDGTITQDDTTYLIPEISRKTHMSHLLQHSLLKSWEALVWTYGIALSEHSRIWAPNERPTTLTQLIAFQRSLRDIEENSVMRCGDLGLLGGVSEAAWTLSGWKAGESRRVKIRAGFLAMIEKLEARQPGRGKWGVVSVNWSQHFLRGVLGSALRDMERAKAVPILANHIDPSSETVWGPPWPTRDGSVNQLMEIADRRRLLNSEDKADAMKSMRNAFIDPLLQSSAPSSVESNKKPSKRDPPRFISPLLVCERGHPPPRHVAPLLIYVGDTLTDLECLLEADVGIIMAPRGRNSMLEVLGHCNKSVIHIAHYQPQPLNSLWFATDFTDITASRLLDDGPPPPVS